MQYTPAIAAARGILPMKITLNDAQPNDAVVDLTERLIEPFVSHVIFDLVDVDQVQKAIGDVFVDGISRRFTDVGHQVLPI